jgi:hypothetical protein
MGSFLKLVTGLNSNSKSHFNNVSIQFTSGSPDAYCVVYHGEPNLPYIAIYQATSAVRLTQALIYTRQRYVRL